MVQDDKRCALRVTYYLSLKGFMIEFLHWLNQTESELAPAARWSVLWTIKFGSSVRAPLTITTVPVKPGSYQAWPCD